MLRSCIFIYNISKVHCCVRISYVQSIKLHVVIFSEAVRQLDLITAIYHSLWRMFKIITKLNGRTASLRLTKEYKI